MKDEGFLSPAGKRFIAIATLLIVGGLIAYYATSEEISLEFLEDIGQTSTTSSTPTFPEVTVPEIEIPEIEIPKPRKQAPGIPPSAEEQIREAEAIFDCITRAQGDPDEIAKCSRP